MSSGRTRGSAKRWVALILALALRATAQGQEHESEAEEISFHRPEAWAMKYFIGVSTLTPLAPPEVRRPWSLDLGLEAGWVPHLSDEQRRVAFNGTGLDDLNKFPVLGRPRLLLGLPGGFSFELGWVPPVPVDGAKANLVALALERPFLNPGPWIFGLRLYGQRGNVRGDYTCSKGVAAQPPGSPGNPQGCDVPSSDVASLLYGGVALTGGVKIGRNADIHFAGGGTYNDPKFQVNATLNGEPDQDLLKTHGWTGWGTLGAGLRLGARTYLGVEVFYSPLTVNRPPRQDVQHDDLFNVRALFRYRLFCGQSS